MTHFIINLQPRPKWKRRLLTSIPVVFFCFVFFSQKSYIILMGGPCQMITFDDKGGGGGGVTKILRDTYGGSCQMLTFDDKGGGRGVKNPQNTLT